MSTYYSQCSILEVVEKATQKLFEVEITPRLKAVHPLLSSITRLASRYGNLTSREKDDARYFCYRVNAYLNLEHSGDVILDYTKLSKEECRRSLREFCEIFEIGINWIEGGLEFKFPSRIDLDLIESIGSMLRLCKSKKITVNSLPLEFAPFLPHVNKLYIRADSTSAFESSVVVLQRCDIRPEQIITFSNVDLRRPVSSLTIDCISSLYRAQRMKVYFIQIVLSIDFVETYNCLGVGYVSNQVDRRKGVTCI